MLNETFPLTCAKGSSHETSGHIGAERSGHKAEDKGGRAAAARYRIMYVTYSRLCIEYIIYDTYNIYLTLNI